MPFREGFAASVLGGLLCDAVTPVPFGTHAALFGAAHAVVYNIRERLQRDETAVRVVVALLVNLALFLALSFVRHRGTPRPAPRRGRGSSPTSSGRRSSSRSSRPGSSRCRLRTLELARANPSRSA